jgi:hypothetical protein
MPEEYDKFDRHISTWGIVGLDWGSTQWLLEEHHLTK